MVVVVDGKSMLSFVPAKLGSKFYRVDLGHYFENIINSTTQ